MADFSALPPLRRRASPVALAASAGGERRAPDDALPALPSGPWTPHGSATRRPILGARLGASPAAAPPRRPGPGLATLVPARDTPAGRLLLLELPGGPWPRFDGGAAAAVACAPGPLDVSRPLFLDTETTGLAGGTGTLPFVVGVALEQAGRVLVEQAHLEAPGREHPVLAWLAARLAQATVLVTFNGKSFDWPLLRSRYVMNRLPVPVLPPHLDLLHCARRVFRHEAAQHSLQALERLTLGVTRVDDLPGSEVPAVWFGYLRTGRLEGLGRVLAHNHRDVVSMVELLGLLQAAWLGERPMPPGARLVLARLAAERGDHQRALRFLGGPAPLQPGLAAEALELEGALLRRLGADRAAARVLEAALGHSPRPARLRLTLARLYERQLQDFEAARRHALLASGAEPLERHRRRLDRLARRALF